MTFFAFYDYTSAGRGWRGRVLVPAQRAVRRVMRPAFHRLRDLLQFLSDRQETQAAVIADLSAHLGQTRSLLDDTQRNLARLSHEYGAGSAGRDQLAHAYQQLAHAYRALAQDHTAVCRRIALLEDILLQSAAGPRIALIDRDDADPLIEAPKAS